MSELALALYNLFMILCFCFISFQLGGIWEIRRRMKERNEQFNEELIKIYKSRRG